MFYSQDEFCFASDGNMKLLVFPKAFESGVFVALLWFQGTHTFLLYGSNIYDLLASSFNAYTADDQRVEVELSEMFPLSNSLKEWIPVTGSGWLKSDDGRHFIRVSPKLSRILGEQYQHWFIAFDALKFTIVHRSTAWLLADYPIPESELRRMQEEASATYEDMCAKLVETNQGL